MHKTLLAAAAAGALLAGPALAQVSLGAAGQIGAHPGGALPGTAPLTQPATRPLQDARRLGTHARHATRHRADQATTALERHERVAAQGQVDADAGAGVGGHPVTAGGGIAGSATVDTRDAAARAQGVGERVRDTAHAAVNDGRRTAGDVGRQVRRTATGSSVGADARADASAGADDGH